VNIFMTQVPAASRGINTFGNMKLSSHRGHAMLCVVEKSLKITLSHNLTLTDQSTWLRTSHSECCWLRVVPCAGSAASHV